MKSPFVRILTAAAVIGGLSAYGLAVSAATADAPQRGGTLTFMVASEVPSYDLHRETTFGVIHPIAPFYRLLVRINPEDPSASEDFVCDLCVGKVPAATDGGRTYTFKVRPEMIREADPVKQRALMRDFEKRVLDETASQAVTLWWYRIVPYRA